MSQPAALPDRDPDRVRRVLYIEDSAADAAVARQVLEQAGFELDVVDTPSKGLGRLWKRRYAALLVDHRLGGFEGTELVLQLHDLQVPLPPTFVVSASDENALIQRALHNGAAGFIAKGEYADYARRLLEAVTGAVDGA